MNINSRNIIHRATGPVLGLVAFGFYLASLSRGAFPGESATLIAQHTGLIPMSIPSHPLWGMAARVLAAIPVGDIPFRLNLFSALCAAGAVWLLYCVMSKAVLSLIEETEANSRRAAAASILAGIAAAGFLAISIPFRVVANRAHTASFDILLLLVVMRLFVAYGMNTRAWLLYLISFIYGLGLAEFATFIAMFPVMAAVLLVMLLRSGAFRAGTIAVMAAAGLAGMLLYAVSALSFMASGNAAIWGYGGFFDVLWDIWRSQYFLILKSMPREGWLLVLIVTAVPWITVLVVARQGLNGERDWGYYILHIVLTAISVLVLFNTRMSPWHVTKTAGSLLVTPYLLAAMVFGYLAAYWHLLPLYLAEEEESRAVSVIRRAASILSAVILIALLAIAAPLNGRFTGTAVSKPTNEYARSVVDCLSGRTWLLTDGRIDNLLRIAARDRGIDLNILNVYGGRDELYMRYVASLFPEVRMKNLAGIGMLPLLQEWIATDGDIRNKLAVLTLPELWMAAGYTIVPNKLVFLGMSPKDAMDAGAILADHEDFWKTAIPAAVVPMPGWNADGKPAVRPVARQIGLVANNLGVMMEDNGRPADAYKAYLAARQADPENISALLNLVNLLDKGFQTDLEPSLRKEMAELAANTKKKYYIWELSRHFGFVRTPQAFAGLGWVWARSGQPGPAIAGLSKASSLLPDSDREKISQALAGLYLAVEKDDRQSARIYEDMLAANPTNTQAMIGLAGIHAMNGDFPKAKELLQSAERSGADKTRIALEWATCHMLSGDTGQARVMLQELTALAPGLLKAWVLLAQTAIKENDLQTFEECAKKMEKLDGGPAYTAAMRARQAEKQGNLQEARRYYEKALVTLNDNVQLLEQIVKLDIVQSRYDTLGSHARNLLKADPSNPWGSYGMARLQIKNGNYDLAEDSLRTSIKSEETPKALNDLAWLLTRRKAYVEAEKLARRSVELNPKFPEIWDTLGTILMRTDQPAEAEEAFQNALSLSENCYNAILHLAQLKYAGNDIAKATELARRLAPSRSKLGKDEQDEFDDLRDRLESGRKAGD